MEPKQLAIEIYASLRSKHYAVNMICVEDIEGVIKKNTPVSNDELIKALERFTNSNVYGSIADWNQMVDDARAIISKAKGSQ